ncbi:hypothetical protein QQY66_40010 [Streptomyces sp. DG2A-72]|uniref:hypothetical protein n=1 Tax=Streptomyces sp. DG2A-72 TaxID=3051386 RepID=UPI00265C2C38|nr:hypothetical protein [Streptomyces sp. DG2A-72]MDO0937615.1 hypothetical protein [Streptomyces sp. DG2A-72]
MRQACRPRGAGNCATSHDGAAVERRRIALIQLLQRTALLSGTSKDDDWRTAVKGRVTECEAQLARLTAPRAHLATGRFAQAPSVEAR